MIHPSWQAQLKGRKRWYLSPPPECYYSCNSMEVVMYPGEISNQIIYNFGLYIYFYNISINDHISFIVVIDTNRWYHKTEILPGDISITIGAEYD